MKKYSASRLRAVFLVYCGLVSSFGLEARAQTAGTPVGAASPASDQVISLNEFVVTGSHIPTTETADTARAYPVLVIDRRAVDLTGYENTAKFLQSVPDFNEGASPISNNDTGFTRGATSVSLHGLGPDATLVLVDGHRVANFPVGGGSNGDQGLVDLNSLPPGYLWDRVEIKLDGASAIYGADAVAGVVNINLVKNFNGSEMHLQYQNTTDKDASQFTADMLAGVSNKNVSLLVGFNYQKQNSITDADRAYSLIPSLPSSNSSPINAQVTTEAYEQALNPSSPTGYQASKKPPGTTKNIFFATPGITPGAPGGNTLSPTGLPVSPSTNFGGTPVGQYLYSNTPQSVYDYNQNAWSFPATMHEGVMLSGEFNIFGTPKITAYADASYQESEVINESAPAAPFGFEVPGFPTIVIPANNQTALAGPLLFAISKTTGNITAVAPGTFTIPNGSIAGPGTIEVNGKAQRLAPAGAYNNFNPFDEDISGATGYRLQDFGNRIWDDTTEAGMATAGLRGNNILDKFSFDAGIRYSEDTYRTDDTQVSASKFNRILNANDPIFNPSSPQYIGTTVPYNPFGYYTNSINSPLLIQYATIHVHDKDFTSTGNGYFTLDTTDLFTLPAGKVGMAAGLDFRMETLNQTPDPESAAGDVIGQVPESPVDRERKIAAAFAELEVPIIGPAQHLIGLHRLSADIAGRYEDFLTGHEDDTVPQASVLYQPFDDSFALRGTAARGFLAPSMEKLYTSGILHSGTLINTANHTLTSEIPIIDVGNSQLQPETSDSYSAGFVWSPKFAPLKGFTMNVDCWRIDRNGTALVNNQNTLNNYNNGTAMLPGESVSTDPITGNVNEVVSVYHNAGESIAKGADIGGSYVYDTRCIGLFDYSVDFADLHSFRQASAAGQPLQELVDTSPLDAGGQDAYLRRRVLTSLDWSYKNYELTATGHFTDGFQDFDLNDNPRRVGSSWTWDLRLGYTFKGELGPYLRGTTLAVGSINIFNRPPPVVIAGGSSSDNYPGYLYTSEGREVYVSLDKRF